MTTSIIQDVLGQRSLASTAKYLAQRLPSNNILAGMNVIHGWGIGKRLVEKRIIIKLFLLVFMDYLFILVQINLAKWNIFWD